MNMLPRIWSEEYCTFVKNLLQQVYSLIWQLCIVLHFVNLQNLDWVPLLFAGMPVGLQLMGKPWCEGSLLYAGSVLESAARPLFRMPKVCYDVLGGSCSAAAGSLSVSGA